MKKITFIRHAKSSWAEPGISDFDRPLNRRGLRDAPKMAEFYAERLGKSPDKIVSSSALRARTTAVFFGVATLIPEDQIILEPNIYEATPDKIFETINAFDPSWNHVIMFGHNPGFSYMVGLITSDLIEKVTCSISEVELYVENWNEVSPGTGKLVFHDYPKNHSELS